MGIVHRQIRKEERNRVPEFISVFDLPAAFNGRSSARDLIEPYEVAAGEGNIPLSRGSNQDLRYARERAASGQSMPIEGRAEEEDDVRDPHGNGQRTEGRAPSVLHLNIHHHGEGDDRPDGDGEVE